VGEVTRLEVVAGIVLRAGRVLAARRAEGGPRGGCWELPGGKVEPGEQEPQTLARELREELELAVSVGRRFLTVEHDYPDLRIRLHAYLCRAGGEPTAREHQALRWLAPDELLAVAWSAADRLLVEALQRAIAAGELAVEGL